MKCANCQSEWTSPKNKSLSICPFCQTDILQMLNKQAEVLSTEVILSNMLQVHGSELLQNQQRLSAMISDLFAHDPKSKRLLLLSVRENIPLQLIAIKYFDTSVRTSKIHAIQHRLAEDAFLKEDAAEQIIAFWISALGLEFEEPEDSFEIIWQKGYCGFRNSKGDMITPFKYDGAEDFSENLALVKQNAKFGFINKEGVEIFPLTYSHATSFSHGLAYVEVTKCEVTYQYDDRCVEEDVSRFFINSNGDVVFELSDNCYWYPFSNGLARVYRKDIKKYGYINTKGDQVIDFEYEKAMDFKNGIALVAKNAYSISGHDGNFGFINTKGIEFIPANYEYAEQFSEGLAAVELQGKWGFINKVGKVVIQPKYGRAKSFSNGLAPVYLNRNWGYIDKNDEIIIPFNYDSAKPFKYGAAYVENSIYYGLINLKGQVVSEFKYTHLLDFTNGVSLARNDNLGKYGLINEKGEEVSEFKYDWFETIRDSMWGEPEELNFINGLVRVKIDDKFGFLNFKGEEAIPIIYDDAMYLNNGLFSVKLNGNSYYINKNNIKISLDEYDYNDCLIDFNEGLSIVKSKKYGFVDYKWKRVIPLIYDKVENFSEGLAAVKLNGKYGFLNRQGQVIISLRFDDVTSFKNGLAIVTHDNKSGLIDKTGRLISPLKYNSIKPFRCNMARVEINNKWGFVNSAEKEIISIKYEAVSDFDANIALACLDRKWGAINMIGEEVIEFHSDSEFKCREFALIQINLPEKNGRLYAKKYYWNTNKF
jgi:hypothetical protein